MKKSFLFIVSILLSFCFLSCNSKTSVNIIGKWEAKVTLKSELGDGKSEVPTAYLYTNQEINLAFAEGGIYTKKVVQAVDRVEFSNPSSEEDVAAAKEYLSQFYNKNLTFDGTYQQDANGITFTVENVSGDLGENLSYDDYFSKDPAIGDDEIVSSYEVKDGSLVIDGMKFKKID